MIYCFSDTSVVLKKLKNITSHEKKGIAIPVSDTEKATEVLKETQKNPSFKSFKGDINPIVPMPDNLGQITSFPLANDEHLKKDTIIFVDYNSDGENLSLGQKKIKEVYKNKACLVPIGVAIAQEGVRLIQCQVVSQMLYWRLQEFIALNRLQEEIKQLEWLPVLGQDFPFSPSIEDESLGLSSEPSFQAKWWEPSVLGTIHKNEQELLLERLQKSPDGSTDNGEPFSVRFEEGWPVEINKKPLTSLRSLKEADAIAKEYGIGIQNYPLKVKDPFWVEAPGIVLLEKCYEYLLQLILDRRARRYYRDLTRTIADWYYHSVARTIVKRILEIRSGGEQSNSSLDLIKPFHPIASEFPPLRSDPWLDLIEPMNRLASGTIEVTLYKGNIAFHKASDVPHSLYSEETASMEAIGDFDHADSEGFLAVLGVGARASAVAGQTQE